MLKSNGKLGVHIVSFRRASSCPDAQEDTKEFTGGLSFIAR